MATAKGTPVTSEITPMYSGVNVRAGARAEPGQGGRLMVPSSPEQNGRRVLRLRHPTLLPSPDEG